jgi:hypothetical protein
MTNQEMLTMLIRTAVLDRKVSRESAAAEQLAITGAIQATEEAREAIYKTVLITAAQDDLGVDLLTFLQPTFYASRRFDSTIPAYFEFVDFNAVWTVTASPVVNSHRFWYIVPPGQKYLAGSTMAVGTEIRNILLLMLANARGM